MIRPLRTIHRRTFYILGILLPLLLAAALIARRPAPVHPATIPAFAPNDLVGGAR